MQTAQCQHVGSAADVVALTNILADGRLVANAHGRHHRVGLTVEPLLAVTLQHTLTQLKEVETATAEAAVGIGRLLLALPLTDGQPSLLGCRQMVALTGGQRRTEEEHGGGEGY